MTRTSPRKLNEVEASGLIVRENARSMAVERLERVRVNVSPGPPPADAMDAIESDD